jgi:hypothetical protein
MFDHLYFEHPDGRTWKLPYFRFFHLSFFKTKPVYVCAQFERFKNTSVLSMKTCSFSPSGFLRFYGDCPRQSRTANRCIEFWWGTTTTQFVSTELAANNYNTSLSVVGYSDWWPCTYTFPTICEYRRKIALY